MIAAITSKISANATTIIKQLFSDRTPIEITTIVEIDFHSISNLVSTYMKAMAFYANILRISTHVPPLRMSAWEVTWLYDHCKNVSDLSDYMETNLNKENKFSRISALSPFDTSFCLPATKAQFTIGTDH